MSIYAGLFTNEGTGLLDPVQIEIDYMTGTRGTKLLDMLKGLVTVGEETVNVEMLDAQTTSQPTVFDLTVEFWLDTKDAESGERIFDTIKAPGFVKSIGRKAIALSLNVHITEVKIVYPSKLEKNMETE